MTAAQAVDRAQVKRPELTDADGLLLIDDANKEILSRVHLISDLENITTMSASVRTYDFDPSVVRVWSARLQNSATTSDYTTLAPINFDQIETENPNFLKQDDTTPRFWYINHSSDGTLQIAVDPAPSTASASGYPRIIVRVTRANTLSSGTLLPIGIPNHRAWWLGVVAYWDELNNPSNYPQSRSEFDQAISELMVWRQGVNAKVRPKVQPWQTSQRVRRI